MVRSKWSSSIFHEPVGDGRQRDIFPIPSLDAGGLKRQHVCRAVSRRLNRRAHVAERVNRAIRSLNSLYFGKGSFEDNTATSLADMPLNQRLTVEGIIDAVKYLGPPPDACDPGSQKALRVAASAYYEPEVGIGDVVPLQFSQLSLPSAWVRPGWIWWVPSTSQFVMWWWILRIACCRMRTPGRAFLGMLHTWSPTVIPVCMIVRNTLSFCGCCLTVASCLFRVIAEVGWGLLQFPRKKKLLMELSRRDRDLF